MGIRVLIVDDSATIRKIVSRCLRQSDLKIAEVYEAGNGQEALGWLAKQTVDIVLTDINMPQMDGLQLLSAIRLNETWKSIPVLMITSEAGAEAVVEAVKQGAAGYIKKPFTPMQIHDKIAPVVSAFSQSQVSSQSGG